MKRYCLLSRIKPERIEEYRARHAAVWPEMLEALHECGWRNYSLFLAPDGLLVGYVESEDLDAAQRAMAATAVNARWQAEMAELFDDAGGERRPDEQFVRLEPVFNLKDQRQKAGLP
ncbi:L-rhamnose mutarotase [Georgenia sp. 10Sc9-8]|uniref:L-rhamnose mutarotase n=1 Tax=Georgenia halotolerans TaxID=3028317 RepID=A0ABT5U144_9MICO|nr:L-rhamnose mutarotase [Georgenia halotolerans]